MNDNINVYDNRKNVTKTKFSDDNNSAKNNQELFQDLIWGGEMNFEQMLILHFKTSSTVVTICIMKNFEGELLSPSPPTKSSSMENAKSNTKKLR